MPKPSSSKEKHPDAARDFTDDEWEAVCAAADKTMVFLGRGWSSEPYPNFAAQLVRFLGRTGIHPSLVGRLGLRNLNGDVLEWRRTKTGKVVYLPVHHELLPWVESFLATPKPRSRGAYHAILKKVEAQVQEDTGADIHVNALRFRHFAARSLAEMGLTQSYVAQALRCTERVLDRYYLSIGPESLKEKMRAAGW